MKAAAIVDQHAQLAAAQAEVERLTTLVHGQHDKRRALRAALTTWMTTFRSREF